MSINFRNTFRVSCHNASAGKFFVEEVTLSSEAFPLPVQQAAAIRRMYENAEPRIDVLMISQLTQHETAWF